MAGIWLILRQRDLWLAGSLLKDLARYGAKRAGVPDYYVGNEGRQGPAISTSSLGISPRPAGYSGPRRGGYAPCRIRLPIELQGMGMAGTMATGPDRAVMRAAAAMMADFCGRWWSPMSIRGRWRTHKRWSRLCATSGRAPVCADFYLWQCNAHREGGADMPKLAIIATIDVAPGRRDQLVHLLMAHKARCLKDEPGTLQFEVMVPREDNAKVLLYEVYQDDAAFDTHFNGASITRLREEAAGMILKLQGTRCTPVEWSAQLATANGL
jgi:(4S)-4-hydroxy-5-phosphonooxypentane-2,3-dione isomerase